MAPESKLPRDAQGRFLKRGGRGRGDPVSGDPVQRAVVGSRSKSRQIGGLAVLTLAMIAGVLGFVFHPFWVVSLVLMGVLWGSIATARYPRESEKGIVSETVTAAVDEAKEISDVAHQNRDPR